MSNLDPSILVLDKGLNLQTSKIIAPHGSVFDSLNYEQVDFQGQKRIDGYARYDGSTAPILDEYYKVVLDGTVTINNGALVFTEDSTLFGIAVGSAAESGDTALYVAVINQNIEPEAADALTLRKYNADGVLTSTIAGTVVSSVLGVASGVTAAAHYTNLLTFSTVLRGEIESLLGPIAGLHWFRDRLYAVAGVVVIALNGTTPLIHPNDTLVSGSESALVLDAFVSGLYRYVFLDVFDVAFWQQEGLAVTVNAVSVGTTAGLPLTSPEDGIATFFESRTEQQAIDEDGVAGPVDFGWRLIRLGWEVLFADGLSLFGSLPSLNQNIQGLGTQGPTSTTGNNGRPLVLLQKVNITNKQTQVNGWKSSQTPTSYLLDPDNLTTVDTDYIYADAYITWDGTTGQVLAPGLTSGVLTEYPATNTVEVDV